MNVLMYHDVVAPGGEDASGFPGRDAGLYKLTRDLFAAHLDAIAVSARDRNHAARPAALLTFDDGGVSALVAADLLEERGFIGHFFVTTNYIGTRGFLTDKHIRELAHRGHIVGTHSCSHPLRMARCAWTQLIDEWTRSCAALAEILGTEVKIGSVPGGDCSPQVADAAARAGITTLFTSEPATEARHAFGLALVGRFTIQKWTTPDTAAALARGDRLACRRQAVVWTAKKISKRLGGDRYFRLRRLLLGHSPEVRWGDQP
jgi:peptidoglycan/xylan/chitin deacetylase (PgdA/CDA1 family)